MDSELWVPPAAGPEAVAAGPSTTRVTVVADRAGFDALRVEWDALVARTDDQPFYRHAFFQVWLDHFSPRGALRVLTLRDWQGRLCAALPLVRRLTLLHGVPVRELSAAANSHSCRFDLIAEEPRAAAAAFLAHLRATADWDLLRLTDIPEGGRAYALLDRAAAAGLATGAWTALRSPYLPLPATFDTLQQGVDTKFRANLRRRRKRLAEKGTVALERFAGGSGLAERLEEGMRLEASGWKGRRGTAMAQDPATRGFYTELARTAAHTGDLALWFLRVDGRAVAFHYALEHAGRYLLFKPAYDEAARECGPGQLLMEEVLRDCVGRGLRELDFLGPDMPWKRDWTQSVRPHCWLYIFRGPLGRALHTLKFRIGPRAREFMNRWKR